MSLKPPNTPKVIYIVTGYYAGQIAAFYTTAEAEEAAEGKGEWGSQGSVSALELYETLEEYKADEVRKTRERALKKLTDKERAALGLDEAGKA